MQLHFFSPNSFAWGVKATYLSVELSRAMVKVGITNFLCKEAKQFKEAEAEAAITWVEAEADDYKTVEAEAEAEAVNFKNLEAEAEAEAVDFKNLEAEAEAAPNLPLPDTLV